LFTGKRFASGKIIIDIHETEIRVRNGEQLKKKKKMQNIVFCFVYRLCVAFSPLPFTSLSWPNSAGFFFMV